MMLKIQHVFLGRLLLALKKRAGFILADV